LLTLKELYGFTHLMMNPNQGLYESIDIHEVSTLNVKKYVVMQPSSWVF
jgi:hypothetical protein